MSGEMRRFIVYVPGTGEILRSGLCAQHDVKLQAQEDERVMCVADAVDDTGYYVDAGRVVERPQMPVALDRSTIAVGEVATFSGVPGGARVHWVGQVAAVDDGVLEWSSAVPGAVRFRWVCFPFRDAEFTVEVTR